LESAGAALDLQAATHAEVDQETLTVVEVEEQILAAPIDAMECASSEPGFEVGLNLLPKPALGDLDLTDACAHESGRERTTDRFNFRKLWHVGAGVCSFPNSASLPAPTG